MRKTAEFQSKVTEYPTPLEIVAQRDGTIQIGMEWDCKFAWSDFTPDETRELAALLVEFADHQDSK